MGKYDLNEFQIFRQDILDKILKESSIEQTLKKLDDYQLMTIDKSKTKISSEILTSEEVAQMMSEYSNIDKDVIYNTTINVGQNVVKAIFTGKSKINIYIGEMEGHNLVFIYMNSDKYYILNNRWSMEEIDVKKYKKLINCYYNNLHKILSNYISNETTTNYTINTKRFTLTDSIYNILQKYPNAYLKFYPAIYMGDEEIEKLDSNGKKITVKHKNRFTFICAIFDDSSKLIRVGVFDRNGLCPPPDNENC